MDGSTLLAQAIASAATTPRSPSGRGVHAPPPAPRTAAPRTAAPLTAALMTSAPPPPRLAPVTAPPTLPEPAPRFAPLAMGAKGGFPYRWRDPATARMSVEAYDWISSSVAVIDGVARLGGPLTNACISLVGALDYELSPAEEQQLSAAHQAAAAEQLALIEAWESTVGALPEGRGVVVDRILTACLRRWSNRSSLPGGALGAPEVHRVFEGAPPLIVAALQAYFDTLSDASELFARRSRHRAALFQIRDALQSPRDDSASMLLSDDAWAPAFRIRTAVPDIVAALKDTEAPPHEVHVDLRRTPDGRIEVQTGDGEVGVTERESLLAFGSHDELLDDLLAQQQQARLTLRFRGVTRVDFGPAVFTPAGDDPSGWLWPEPIVQAARQGPGAQGGFVFSPDPGIDLSRAGPFGFIRSVLISRLPVISLSTEVDPESCRTCTSGTKTDVRFRGERLAPTDGDAPFALEVERSEGRTTLRASPVELGSRAYVMAASVEHPAADD